jgi:hypothetical protein
MADGSGGQVDEQLCEIQLRVHVVAAAGASQAGQDRGRSATARIADEQTVLSIMEILT